MHILTIHPHCGLQYAEDLWYRAQKHTPCSLEDEELEAEPRIKIYKKIKNQKRSWPLFLVNLKIKRKARGFCSPSSSFFVPPCSYSCGLLFYSRMEGCSWNDELQSMQIPTPTNFASINDYEE